MNIDTAIRIQRIAEYYHYDSQSRQCIEEMAELTQAINKFWRIRLKCGERDVKETRHDSKEYTNLIEEIADVQIMLWQMEYMLYGRNRVEDMIDKKLDRTLQRINGEKALRL